MQVRYSAACCATKSTPDIWFSGYKAVFLSCGLIVLAVSFLWVVSFGKITKGLTVCVYSDGGDKTAVQKMSRPVLTACIFAILIISIPTTVHDTQLFTDRTVFIASNKKEYFE